MSFSLSRPSFQRVPAWPLPLALALSAAFPLAAQTLPAVTVTAPAEGPVAPLDQPTSSASRLGLTVRETPASIDVVPAAVWPSAACAR